MLSTRKTITLALMCALASTTALVGCKEGAQQGQAAQRQMPPTEVTYVTAKTSDQTIETTLTAAPAPTTKPRFARRSTASS